MPLGIKYEKNAIFATIAHPFQDLYCAFHFPYARSNLLPGDIAASYLEAVNAAVPRLRVAGPRESRREVPSDNPFSSKKHLEVTTTWSLDGTTPWSMPPVLDPVR